MKKFCRYAVVDIRAGNLLACGQKRKDFERGNIRYVEVGTFRVFPFLWRTVTECYRTLEINGVPCAIVYWVYSRCKKFYNCVTLSGYEIGLRGQVYDLSGEDYPDVYGSLLTSFGVVYENV